MAIPQIGPSPLEAFQIGSQLRGPTALGQFAQGLTKHLMSQMELRQQARIKGEEEFKLQERLIPLKTKGAVEVARARSAAQPFKPLSSEGSGRFALARMGAQEARRAEQFLFPGGTPESFQRGLATGATNPIARAWGLGFGKPEDLQGTYHSVYNAYYNKIRIESGAAVPDKEIERQAKISTANFFSAPREAQRQLTILREFHDTVQKTMDPTGAYGGLVNPTDFAQPTEQGLLLDESGLPQGGSVLEWLD